MVKVNSPLFLVLYVLRYPLPEQVHLKYLNVLREDKALFQNFNPVLDEKDFVIEILKTVRGEGGIQNIFDADIVVSGGRGTQLIILGLLKNLLKH